MRKVREVLRLHFELGCKHRQIAAACSISSSTVSNYLERAARAGLTWQAAQKLNDAEVESRLFTYSSRSEEDDARASIDFEWVHNELARVGVTLQLLWGEYQGAANAAGKRAVQYSQFCELYAAFRRNRRLSMRQTHLPGERLFIDYSGKKPHWIDSNGELREVELFVAVLGASNYTYVEATHSQTIPDFCASMVRALEYFGAAPKIIVPDQLKSAVSKSDRYDPDINPTFQELAEYYGMAVIPAPPRKPKGKAKVEVGVLIAQRWILARLRNRSFFSLAELNQAISELQEELNTRRFQKLKATRRELFLQRDRPAMKVLPALRFEIAERKQVRAGIDYHIEFAERYYSVPHRFRNEKLEVRATTGMVEIFHDGTRIASHRRCYHRPGTAVTDAAHRPQSHQDYGQWPPERLISWAETFGPHVKEVVCRTLARYPYPEMGYRPVLGIMRVAEKHGKERMNAACQRALTTAGKSAPHRRFIEAILKQGLDRAPLPPPAATTRCTNNEYIRGPDYFDKEESHVH